MGLSLVSSLFALIIKADVNIYGAEMGEFLQNVCLEYWGQVWTSSSALDIAKFLSQGAVSVTSHQQSMRVSFLPHP